MYGALSSAGPAVTALRQCLDLFAFWMELGKLELIVNMVSSMSCKGSSVWAGPYSREQKGTNNPNPGDYVASTYRPSRRE